MQPAAAGLRFDCGLQPRSAIGSGSGHLEPADETVVSEALPRLERSLIARLTRPAIVQALATLPEDMRSALLLCDLEGFTYEDIARILDCPIGTVRSRIARARTRLIRQLAPHAAALGIGKGSLP